MVLCRDVASLTVNQLDRCNLLRRSIVCYATGKASYWPVLSFVYRRSVLSKFSFAIAEQPEEGWAMSQMTLIYVVGPMFWHWREA